MADFKFLQNKINGKWVVSAPRRSHRTNVEKAVDICPFCPGNEIAEEELYRIQNTQNPQKAGGSDVQIVRPSDTSGEPSVQSFPKDSNWLVRVVANKFPFAPNHEVVIHSPDHHKSFDELPLSAVELILQTYKQRFNTHKKGGRVYIFHNSGSSAGASLGHPHTQLVVIPHNIKLDITPLDQAIYEKDSANRSSISHLPFSNDLQSSISKLSNKEINGKWNMDDGKLETEHFLIFCPATSDWPDEAWIAPKQNGGGFGFIKDEEITDLSFVLSRLIQIFDLRHGHEFPFNFYIYPGKNWYLRLIPRVKIIGGFELGTNIIVNTQDPAETFGFIKEHFWSRIMRR